MWFVYARLIFSVHVASSVSQQIEIVISVLFMYIQEQSLCDNVFGPR